MSSPEPEPSGGAPPKHIPRKPVLYTFGGITIIGIAAFTMSWQYPLMSGHQMGPGMVPLIASAGLTVLGVLLLVDEIRRGSILEGDGAGAAEIEQTPEQLKATHRKLVLVGLITLAACLLFPLLGLLPALCVAIFALSAFVEKMPKALSAIIAAAAFGVMYVIFVAVLHVDMPFGAFSPEFWSRA